MELGALEKEIRPSGMEELKTIALGAALIVISILFWSELSRFALMFIIPLNLVCLVMGILLFLSGIVLLYRSRTTGDTIQLYAHGVKIGDFEATYPALTMARTSNRARGRLVFVTTTRQLAYNHPLSNRKMEFIEKTVEERH